MRSALPYRNRGQAMAEFVVMTAGCLLLLFVLVPVVAKLSDMSYKAQEMARYTAWERTVWYATGSSSDSQPSQIASDGHLAMRSDRAIFNSAERRVMSFTQHATALDPKDIDTLSGASNNQFWRWTHGKGGQGMSEPGSTADSSSLRNSRTPSIAYSVIDTYNNVMGKIAKVVSIFSFGQGDDDFLQVAHPIHNFYATSVDIPVPMAGSQLGSKPLFGDRFTQLNVKARSAVLADGWVAQSEEHFRNKADDFVMGNLIENNPIFDTVRSIIGIFEPSFKTLDFAPIDTAPMPDTDVDCNVTTGFCYYKKK
jgi:hypothetical protein